MYVARADIARFREAEIEGEPEQKVRSLASPKREWNNRPDYSYIRKGDSL